VITPVFTSESTGYTWAVSNKSDAHTTGEPGGGSPTYVLGAITGAQTNTTSTATATGVVDNSVHLGTWVTPVSPEAFTMPKFATFALNNFKCWEQAGNQNSYLEVKISIVTESGGVLSWGRTLMDWWTHPQEPGTSSGSSGIMGGATSDTGVNFHYQLTQDELIQTGECIAIEIAMKTTTTRINTCNFDFGSEPDTFDDATLAINAQGTGPYGSSIGLPVNFTEANQDAWGGHHEFTIPKFAGTNLIPWADIGSDYTTTKWENVSFPAARYVIRNQGQGLASIWTFQDDDYLYFALNNHEDGCIQSSDHHAICLGIEPLATWGDSLTNTSNFYEFKRDITSGTSVTRDPTLPVAAGDDNDGGEFILRGDPAATYPIQWEVPTLTTGFPNTLLTFTGAEVWDEGVDYRMGGPGATSTAPAPTGIVTGKAYSEFKISKAKLGWDGDTPIAFMLHTQCDTQVKGHVVYPPILGRRVDLSDWNFTSGIYEWGNILTYDVFADNSTGTLANGTYTDVLATSSNAFATNALFDITITANAIDTITMVRNGHNFEVGNTLVIDATLLGASGGTLDSTVNTTILENNSATSKGDTVETMDMRPIMMAHAHSDATGATYNPTETFTGSTTTQNATLNIGHRPSESVSGVTTTQNAQVDIGYRPTETITGVTTTQDANITVGAIINPIETITGVTTTQDANITVGATINPTETITGATTTQNTQVDIGYRPTETITGTTTTQDAQVDIGYRPTETITGATTTQDAQVDIGYRPTETITGVTTTQDADITVGAIINPTETITGATSTQDAQVDIGYRPTETITGATSTQDAQIDIGYRPTETISGATATQDADITIEGNINPTETITGATSTQDAQLDIGYGINETFTSSTTTQNAQLDIGYLPTVTITGITSTDDAIVNIGHRIGVVITSATTTQNSQLDIGYRPTDVIDGTTTTQDADITVTAQGQHNPTETITGATTTQDAQVDIGYRPTETISGSTSTQDANLDIGYRPTETISGTTSTQDANLDIGYRPTETISGSTTTQDANITVGAIFNPTETITGVTTTQDAQVDIGYRPSETINGVTTTQDAELNVGYRPSETITGSTITQDANISIEGAKVINPTSLFPVYSRSRYANITILVEQGTGVGGVPIIAGGGRPDTHVDALKKRKLPKVTVLDVKYLGESESININISVFQVTDLLMEDV
jgi:hypothetical protein